MTNYFVDPKSGSDKKGDGLTPDTAFQTRARAEEVAHAADRKKRIKTRVSQLPLWRRILWPWLTKIELEQTYDWIYLIPETKE